MSGANENILSIISSVNSISLSVTPNPAHTHLTPVTELVVRVSPDCL